jgi:hypothetical protein
VGCFRCRVAVREHESGAVAGVFLRWDNRRDHQFAYPRYGFQSDRANVGVPVQGNVRRYPRSGPASRCGSVIEGSVRKSGDQLRITAQAIETESGHHLWSKTFRPELKDVFAIQEELAQSVVGLLRLKMPSARASAPSFRNPVMNGLHSVITFGDES